MNTSNDKIDQLIKQKLLKVEKTPRPQAWEKLESRLAEKQQPAIPLWRNRAIAASLALLFLMGGIGYFKIKNAKISSEELANNNINIKTPIKLKAEKPQLLQNKIEFEKEVLAKSTTKTTTFKKSIAKNKILNLKEITTNNFIENKELIVKEIASITNENQDINNPLNNELKTTTLSTDNSVFNNIAVVESKTEESKISTNKLEDLTIVLTLNDYTSYEPKTEKLKEKKAPFFSRIFQQLKNAKNGEKVDWNEIGFKPAKLLARAETKLTKTQ